MSISVIETGKNRRIYQVRVMRRGKSHSKTFSTLREARQYERELQERLGPPASQKGKPKKTAPPNTGIKRIVRRIFQRAGRSPVAVYTVYWRTPEGQPRYSNISIDHWGEKKALQLAKRKKREMDARYLGQTTPARKKKRRTKS